MLAQAGDDAASVGAFLHGEVHRESAFLVEGSAAEEIAERFEKKFLDVRDSQFIAGFRRNPGSSATGFCVAGGDGVHRHFP